MSKIMRTYADPLRVGSTITVQEDGEERERKKNPRKEREREEHCRALDVDGPGQATKLGSNPQSSEARIQGQSLRDFGTLRVGGKAKHDTEE